MTDMHRKIEPKYKGRKQVPFSAGISGSTEHTTNLIDI
jgi:hypothetical protein